ncbi:QcrA and Rieske domain-containing protein [Paeniglutamicibacter psychrophenolicus]|uniref:QcrA and Rieske domain-containing protein n=1 Tax=Paeniglutamicibacter psychrophenolicus TaxID=257454 RepID=UPI002786C3F8|nr:Rieske (2Fe-2S) protein [Paeniglutamicibacter psychrophenolicus]MDQ0094482.1 Rieske Fe-S protein [Paeniglutamicibacter psychrophenolicus]
MKQHITLMPTRRSVIEASLVAGAAVTLVSCGSGGKAQDLPQATGKPVDAIALAKLPVKGTASVTVNGAGYLLYRPDEATVLAYTSVCTHQGCKVGTGSGEAFKCPCHGSEYSKLDGSVIQGPAPKSLARFATEVDGPEVKILL